MNRKTSVLSIALLSIALTAMVGMNSCSQGWDIENPYETVNWSEYGQYKANFHTHTTRSDGRLNPHDAVDAYHELGYTILAITDHNLVTYPWTGFSNLSPSQRSIDRAESDPQAMPDNFVFENRDPRQLGMIDIEANELSSHHHMGSFFNDHIRPVYGQSVDFTVTEEESIEDVGSNSGIVMLYHPGRYDKTLDWYVDIYTTYDHVFGLEVYNQGDRYPDDRLLWDSILTVTLPDRQVWGYSNDDMHVAPHIGRNWNMLMLPEPSHEQVRHAMENGLSYFVYAPEGHQGPAAPAIDEIHVNRRRGTISITASETDRIIWISEGRIVHEGYSISLDEIHDLGKYVRAELLGAGSSITSTQAFVIHKP